MKTLSLRWRITVLSGSAIALLSIFGALIAFWVVRTSLIDNLERHLMSDARRVADTYQQRGPSRVELEEGPTGSVHIQIYSLQGAFLTSSSELYGSSRAVPAPELLAALSERGIWEGRLGGRSARAAVISNESPPSIIAVLTPTDHIGVALRQLAEALAVAALLLTLLSAFIGYLVATAAIKPISDLASAAARLDAERLEPIAYQGPNDEVGQLTQVLNDLITRVKTLVDAQRTFLAETSHELRTPLTSLQGFLERAVRRAGPEVHEELEDARRISQSMSRLVADLLQLSRGELVREYDPHLLDPYTDLIKPVAEEFPGVRVSGKAGLLLLGDPERLRQLLRNLTANALRATGDPSKVQLELCEENSQAVLRVRDSGPGIPPEVLPHIFSKFYRGAGGGAGLGLAIAKQIIKTHEGEISVASETGNGAVFTVRLPAYAEESEEESAYAD